MKKSASLAVFVVSLLGVAITLFTVTMNAQGDKKGGKKAPGILHPDWAAEKGSYASPMGKLGTKPDEPWSNTTLGASINGKPQDGHVATVVGEVLDFSCYLQVGKHGEKHRSCAQKCFTAGQPIGLLAEDGTMYMLMEEEHDPRRDGLTDFRKAAIDHASHIMEVTGTLASFGGYRALYVQGYLKK